MTKVTAKMVLAACDAYRKSADRKPVNGSFAEDMERALVAALSSHAPPIVAAGEPEAALSATDTQIIQPSHDDEGLIERLKIAVSVASNHGDHWTAKRLTGALDLAPRLKGERDEARATARRVPQLEFDLRAVTETLGLTDEVLDRKSAALAAAESRSLLLEAELEALKASIRMGIKP